MKPMESYLLKKHDIYIYNVDNRKYMLYTPKNVIFAVNNVSFEKYLSLSLCADSQVSEADIPFIKQMHGYFFDSINKLDDGNKGEFNRNDFCPSCVVLNISGGCNLRCSYCFARNDNGFIFGYMTLDTALRSIDLMIKINPNAGRYTISFFGGEPLLKMSVITKVMEYTLKTYGNHKFHFTATTNGTILTSKIISDIKQYGMSLLVSLDGPKKITNSNRPHVNKHIDTFDLIKKNIDILKHENIDFSLRSTIVAGDANLVDYADFFEKLKIGYYFAFCFDTVTTQNIESDWNDANIDTLSQSFQDLMEYYFNKIRKKESIYAYFLLEQLRSIALRHMNYFSCGAGRNMFAVNSDETIFSCMNYSPMRETGIGSIHKGINTSKNDIYRPKHIDDTECRFCNIRYLCGGGCMAERYVDFKTIDKANSNKCKLQKIIFNNYLRVFQRIKNLNHNVIDNIA